MQERHDMTAQSGNGAIETLDVTQVAELFAADKIVLIDVRTPVEFAFEHIRGALLSPLATFDTRHLPSQESKPIVFHCGSGMRSKMVAEKCLAAGFAKVMHMGGGFMAWKKAGQAYIATNPATGAPVDRRDPVQA
ncbi:MAG: rhodanese-like domain-containing protein [Hyphomicrobiaceae bacterium]|nr:rhodanese-like domain-containing protein [Hyphomicrobiaceae bacterium]